MCSFDSSGGYDVYASTFMTSSASLDDIPDGQHIDAPGLEYSIIRETQGSDAFIVAELNRPIASDTPFNLPPLQQKVIKYSYDIATNNLLQEELVTIESSEWFATDM